MQLFYMIMIALFAGLFAGGVVWVFWDNALALPRKLRARREAKMLEADADAEAGQANDAPGGV